jgi:alpha-tubulin suppressor-like RCC1 family protein
MKFTSLENLQYFLSKLSYVSKESEVLNSIITSYLNDFKRDVVQIVSTLPNPGETGVLYLVPQGDNRFIEYYYNNNEYIQVGSSVFDFTADAQLSNASKNPVQNKVISNALDTKLNASQLVNALNNTSSETPQSQVIYNLLNDKTSSDDFLKISNSDINFLFDILLEEGKLACSTNTTWIVGDDGNLYGCGDNSMGQQGSGDTTDVLTFTKRAENVKSVQITSGATFYLTNDDKLYGVGYFGNQGTGSLIDTTTFSLKMSNVKEYVIRSGGGLFVLTKSGDFYGASTFFGKNDPNDRNSAGTYSNSLVLRKRAENVKSFSRSDSTHTIWYIDNDNNLYGCGYNDYSQQGFEKGKTNFVSSFEKRAENVKTVIANDEYTLYLDFNGNLYGCGNNSSGQLGSLSAEYGFIKRAENVKEVQSAYNSTWYLTENGDLYGAGANSSGQQGSGDTSNVSVFTKRAENVKRFKVAKYSTWYLTEDDELYGCGYNSGNQGSGDTAYVKTFTKRAENVRDFKCTQYSTWYLTKNGELYGCGYNEYGQQGSGDTSKVLTFTKRAENVENFDISENTTSYLSGGKLYCAGRNNNGQLGTDDTTNRTTFTKTTY